MSCPKVMTASRFNAYTACQRRHFYRYHESYEADVRSEPLLVGSCLHKAMEVWWESKQAAGDAGDIQAATKALHAEMKLLELKKHCGPFTVALVEEMFEGYCGKWAEDNMSAYEVETQFLLPLINPRTKKQHNGWQISGKIDAIVHDHSVDCAYLMDHKCLAFDEELETPGGVKTAKELLYNNGESYVYAYDQREKRTLWQRATFRNNGVRKVVEITTEAGRSIKVTENHPILTHTGRFVEAGDITTRHCVQVAASGTSEYADPDSFVIGALIGDGYISSNKVAFTCSNKELIEQFCTLLDSRGETYSVNESSSRATYVNIYKCGELRHKLSALGLTGQLAGDKKIPYRLQNQNEVGLCKLLGGLWSTDGCFKKRKESDCLRVVYCSKSGTLCKDVQRCLLKVGIRSSIRTFVTEYKGEVYPYYQTTVIGHNAKRRFCDIVAPHIFGKGVEKLPKRVQEASGSAEHTFFETVESVKDLGSQPTVSITVDDLHVYANAFGIVSHNTASQDVAPGATYWEKLKFDKQISMYFLGVRELGYTNVRGFVYDVLKKPYVKRKLMTPKHKQKFKANGLPYSWVTTRDETVAEYRDRVKADIHKNFDKYFRRQVVTRTEEQLEQFRWDLIRVADLIDGEAVREDALQNGGACSMYGKVCPYLQVCTGAKTLEACENLKEVVPFIELEEE